MGIFTRKESNDIYCGSRTIKNLVDEEVGENVSDIGYESWVEMFVREGIRYRDILKKMLEEGYESHLSDPRCDIPDFKTFIEKKSEMIRNSRKWERKTICVEGYVSIIIRAFCGWEQWGRDNAAVEIYPLPCKTYTQKQICYDLMDWIFRKTGPIRIISDYELPVEAGQHIRVHGTTFFEGCHDEYDEDDVDEYGNVPGSVSVLLRKLEILD